MFDQGVYVGRGGGSSGGQGITDVVANYSALPSAAAAADEFYFVESPQGTAWLPGSLGGTYYPAGLYYSNGVTWFYAESPYQATQATVNAGVVTDQFVSPYTLANATTVERPLTFSTGLTRTVNTITANISTGISGGQTIYGGTGASENLTIQSTTNATKGKVIFGSTTGLVFNEALNGASIGYDSQQITIAGTTYDIGLSIHNSVGTFINNELHAASNVVSVGAVSIGTRSRGTYAVPTVVASGDNIWDQYALGYDGTDYAIATGIEHEVDAAVSANIVPGRIVFKTANSSGTLTERLRINSSGGSSFTSTLSISPPAVTTGAQVGFTFTGASNTGQTATAEINRVLYTTGSREWATGAITTQREFLLQAPTYSFVAASTITDAATFAVTAAPIAGTNATITNAYSIWSQSGTVRIDDGTISGGIQLKQLVGTSTVAAIYMAKSTPSSSNYTLHVTSGDTVALNGAFLTFKTSNTNRLTFDASSFIFTPGSASALAITGFSWTSGANVNQTASTEISGVNWNLRTRQWATGAITTQREFLLQAPTYSFVAASTITSAATLAVSAAPIAGTNATITNAYSIWSQSGTVRMDDGTGYLKILAVPTATATVGLFFNQATPSSSNWSLRADISNVTLNAPASSVLLAVAGGTRFTMNSTNVSFNPAAASGGASTTFAFVSSSDANQTASTEKKTFDLASATIGHATGAITTQRFAVINIPTYTFAAASTITTSATFAIAGAPIAGTNATITNSYSLWVQGGTSRFDARLSLNDASDIILGTTTGTKIATGTTQKLGFWNATPIVQPTTAVAAATFAANTSGIVDDSATFDGYTIGQIVKALRNTGLLA